MSVALELQDLQKIYPNGLEAVRKISLQVQEGDFFALLGPNGAGKSTTIGMITGLIRKTSGQIRLFGRPSTQREARTWLGVVPQEFNFNMFEPVLKILLNQAGYFGIPRSNALSSAEALLHQVQLWDQRHTPSGQLSGGMKRRLMVARALVHKPRLLMLDEPTAGADIETRRKLWALLRDLNQQGTTIILTTHYFEEAENLCRTIAIIDHGKILEHTAMQALLRRLDQDTLILYTHQPLTAEACEALYTHFPTRWLDPHSFEVDVHREQSLNALFEVLSAQEISIASIRNKSNRLESLFLKLVTPAKIS